MSGACLGLMVFSVMIVRGLLVGNPTQLILERALVGMLGGVGIGLVAGWIGLIVVADNLPRHEPKPEASPADDAEVRPEPVADPDTVPETP